MLTLTVYVFSNKSFICYSRGYAQNFMNVNNKIANRKSRPNTYVRGLVPLNFQNNSECECRCYVAFTFCVSPLWFQWRSSGPWPNWGLRSSMIQLRRRAITGFENDERIQLLSLIVFVEFSYWWQKNRQFVNLLDYLISDIHYLTSMLTVI